MKMIHGLVLTLTLLVTSSLIAQDVAAPTPATNAVPAPASEVAQTKPAPKESKAPKTPSAPEKPDTIVAINPPETAVVEGDNVNVRGRASFIGEVVTKLRKGESVTLLEEITLGKTKKNEPANWFRIAMPTNTPVWVNANYIDAATKTVKATKLQVRTGPGENFSVVGSLEKGATVKEIRTVEDWIEIETPADTYAFVAADLIDRTPAATPTPPVVPEPAPEVVQVPPAPETAAPAEPSVPAPVEPAPAEPAVTEPVAPPIVVSEPAVEEPAPKRIVTREGIIRRSLNVQTPSYYELESLETGKTINYLYSSKPGFTLKLLIGLRVIVTGEELIDKRWRNTPVIEIESLQTVDTF